ncbi:MAG: PhzF family phenazine biosynthesis protein [bacterium]
MKIKLYQVDAFTDELYHGNPAAVCILKEWLSETQMQNIAAENNLSETAFVVKVGDGYEIRWFTPLVEVNLCGHATLASAFVLFNFYCQNNQKIEFHSLKSGLLTVKKENDLIVLNFPSDISLEVKIPELLLKAFNFTPITAYKGKTDYLLLFSSQQEIEELKPNFQLIYSSGVRGVIATAKGNEADFVSRFFAPFVGINEDPVTGSAHTTLIPFWSEKLGKTDLTAKQLSKRKGELNCQFLGDRVNIAGHAVLYMVGEIEIY